MYLNNGKLKAPTFYKFPRLHINPVGPVRSLSPSSGSVTSTSVPVSLWNSATTPTNDDY